MSGTPRKLADFGALTPAEQKVLDELDTGLEIEMGDDVPDPAAPADRQLRAGFVRWLALGAEDHRLHEKGLRVVGALVTSDGPAGAETRGLDLEGCILARDLALIDCRFADAVLLRSARLQNLYLNGSHLPGLSADGLETRGSVFLRGAEVDGPVRLLGAKIGGALDCVGAKLRHAAGNALHADGLETRSTVSLRGAEVDGAVRLPGARIGGALSCEDATLRNAGGDALQADGAQVTGSLFLRGEAVVEGRCDLTAARFGTITDHPDCWPAAGDLLLHRCEYGAFTGSGVNATARRQWLARQDPGQFGHDFWPQPYEQCARVFREMGHQADARAILIEKERLQRADRRAILAVRLDAARHRLAMARAATDEERQATRDHAKTRLESYLEKSHRNAELFTRAYLGARRRRKLKEPEDVERFAAEARAAMARAGLPPADPVAAARAPIPWLRLRLLGHRIWDCIVGAVVGYGHRPERAAVWALVIWLLGAGIFAWADGKGGMMPNNAFVLRSPEWVRCAAPAGATVTLAAPRPDGSPNVVAGLRGDESPLACYRRQAEARDFPRLQPLVYSADTLLPVVSLHQEAYWTPNPNTPQGWWGRLYLWLHIAAGWALSLLAIAGFSGLVKSD